jgi:hypothetical protein
MCALIQAACLISLQLKYELAYFTLVHLSSSIISLCLAKKKFCNRQCTVWIHCVWCHSKNKLSKVNMLCEYKLYRSLLISEINFVSIKELFSLVSNSLWQRRFSCFRFSFDFSGFFFLSIANSIRVCILLITITFPGISLLVIQCP